MGKEIKAVKNFLGEQINIMDDKISDIEKQIKTANTSAPLCNTSTEQVMEGIEIMRFKASKYHIILNYLANVLFTLEKAHEE